MHICYLDESGVVERSGTSHFVLLGLAIPAGRWRALDTRISAIKQAAGLGESEIHTAWMNRRYPEQDRIPDFASLAPAARRAAVRVQRDLDLNKAAARGQKAVKELSKNYRKTDAYLHLTHDQRVALLRTVADEIASWNDCVLFCDANLKAAHGLSGEKVLEFAFEQIATRFNTFLARDAGGTLGLLVQDQNETASSRLTALMREYHRRGATWSRLQQLIETPLFVDSELTSMVQLADLCSFATRRFFENREHDLFDRIYPRFHRSGNRLVGLRHYTAKDDCRCRVCLDHGR